MNILGPDPLTTKFQVIKTVSKSPNDLSTNIRKTILDKNVMGTMNDFWWSFDWQLDIFFINEYNYGKNERLDFTGL